MTVEPGGELPKTATELVSNHQGADRLAKTEEILFHQVLVRTTFTPRTEQGACFPDTLLTGKIRRVLKLMWAVIGGFSVCLCAAVQGQGPLPVLEALPTAEALGSGWSREISLMFDPASKPPELLAASTRLPESYKKERRATVQNPTNRISGWSHTHFTRQSTNTSYHYDVQIDRYRRKDHLRADFDKLLAFSSAEYQKIPVDGIGEAAVFYRSLKGGATVWFRRADFMVWITPMGDLANWAQDGHLQHLAKMLDQRILKGVAQAMEPSQSEKGRQKP